MPKEDSKPTSFRLRTAASDRLDELAELYGISKTTLVELLIRREYETRSSVQWAEQKRGQDES